MVDTHAMARYHDVLARNLRGFRSRRGVGQDLLAARMRALGFTAWRSSTVAKAEQGQRRITVEEVLGLADAIGVTMRQLLAPQPDDKLVEFPSGDIVEVLHVNRLLEGATDDAVEWDGDKPVFSSSPPAGWMSVPGPEDD
jgi:transcriptional regulator with XRE-family HTH domain